MPTGTITTNASTTRVLSRQKSSNANAQLHLSGTFDSGTVQVEMLADGADTWLAINGGSYTAADDDIINLTNQRYIRLTTTGGGGSMAIVWDLV